MIEFSSLGSSFEIEYLGDKIVIDYDFPNAETYSKCVKIIEGGGVTIDLHKQARALVKSISGLKARDKETGETKIIDTIDKFYSLPLLELQIIFANGLHDDIKKKLSVTGEA